MSLTIASGYTVSSGEVWTPTKHNLSTTIAIQQATATLTGRTTAGTGSIEELPPAQARAILGLATTDTPTLGGLVVTGTAPSGTGITALFASPPAIGGTAPAAAAVTTLAATGLISTATTGVAFSSTGASTTHRFLNLANTTGNLFVGVDASGGGALLGGTAGYSGVVNSIGGPLYIGASNVNMALFSSTGLAITGTMSSTGICSAVSFNATSSRRTKKNIRTLAHDKNRLLGLRPVWYDEKRLGGKEQLVGFIAEELNKFIPGMVSKDLDHRATGINYGPLVSVAIASLQNHERRLAAIEAKQKRLR